MPGSSEIGRQVLRFAVIGVGANAVLYFGYLLLTSQGLGHKVAMTLTYCAGVLCTFVFNRRWTFAHHGSTGQALIRFAAVYGLAYVFQLAALTAAVDVLDVPHRWAMAAIVLTSAALIFLAQKLWVFAARGEPESGQLTDKRRT